MFDFRCMTIAGILSAGMILPTLAASHKKDGSFEAPVVPEGSFTNFTSGQKIGRWTVVANNGAAVSVVSGKLTDGGFSFPAAAGQQWLDLTGRTSNGREGVEQTVDTTAGATYKLTFRVGNVSGGVYGTSSTVHVFINNHQIMSAKNAKAGTTLTWETFVHTFKASTSATTIRFVNADLSNDNCNGLDSVILVLISPPGRHSHAAQRTLQRS